MPAKEWQKDIADSSDIAKSLKATLESRSWKQFEAKAKISLCYMNNKITAHRINDSNHNTTANKNDNSGNESVFLFSNTLKHPLQFLRFSGASQSHLLSIVESLDSVNEPVDPVEMFGSSALEVANAIVRKDYFAFVCAHDSVDERCGNCGPRIYEELTKLVDLLSFETDVVPLTVAQISHVGGHKYAGNLLMYPPGDLYGHVTESNVLDIVKTHILARGITEENWRGRMGISTEKLPDLLKQLKSLQQQSSVL